MEKMEVEKIEKEDQKVNKQFKKVLYDEMRVPGEWEQE